jgi:cell division protein ZapA (FtsZ GTPase activity inhibitor)
MNDYRMDDGKFNIHLNVAGKYYPLTIRRRDEGTVRQAAKLINEKMQQYKESYSEGEIRDFLAMAAVDLVIQLIELKDHKDVSPIVDLVRNLDKSLAEFIDNETTA